MPKPKINHIGDTNIATNGQTMTVVAYRSYTDIDIQFDDGTIITHKEYKAFKHGHIANPNHKPHLHETATASNGMRMAIINYRQSNDITVQFEDKTIVQHVSYSDFKRGLIRHPTKPKENIIYANFRNKRIGTKNTAKNGLIMTIIAYKNANDITIQFEDGIIRKHINYAEFLSGDIKHPTLSIKPYTNVKDRQITGHLYHTEIHGIAHQYQNITHYYIHCPICNIHKIWTFEQIKQHTCNNQ